MVDCLFVGGKLTAALGGPFGCAWGGMTVIVLYLLVLGSTRRILIDQAID